jgi:hypothetical protein
MGSTQYPRVASAGFLGAPRAMSALGLDRWGLQSGNHWPLGAPGKAVEASEGCSAIRGTGWRAYEPPSASQSVPMENLVLGRRWWLVEPWESVEPKLN